MSLLDWYRYHVGGGDWMDTIYHLYLGMWRRVGSIVNYGTPIWDDPWDVMVVLDGCRCDLMMEVADEYGFIGKVGCRYSLGSESGEWMRKNFATDTFGEELANTAYVTANTKTVNHTDLTKFQYADEVWRYGWNDELGTVEAATVTDRAIDVSRSVHSRRLLIHYLQPHFPVIAQHYRDTVPTEALWDADWEDLRRDPRADTGTLRKAALANLRYVLDSVDRLLVNIDAERVVLTSDHGNLYGEWRAGKLYGHPPDVPIPLLKRVPWVETKAENTAGEEPTVERTAGTGDVEEKLRALGYK